MLVYTVYALLGFGLAYLFFNFIVILFTDISVLWELIKELWKFLGGFWGIVGIVVFFVILGVIGTVGQGILSVIGPILYYIAAAIVGIIYVVFEFIEDKSRYGYNVVVTKIANRLEKYQGGSQ